MGISGRKGGDLSGKRYNAMKPSEFRFRKRKNRRWEAPGVECDRTASDEETREMKSFEEAQKIITFGIVGDAVLCIIKMMVGFAVKSPGLLADAFHGLADLVGEFITLVCLFLSRLPRSYLFPYGYGKIEAFGLLAVAAAMVVAGVELIHESYILLSSNKINTYNINQTNGSMMSFIATLVPCLSILLKEMLYQMAVTEAKRQNSPLLESNAWHHRIDGMSSFVALLGVLGDFVGISCADPIAGIIVAILVLNVGVQISWEAVQQLLDMSVSEEDLENFKQMATLCLNRSEHSKTKQIKVLFIRARKMGSHVMLTIELAVNPKIKFYRISEAQERISQYIQNNNENVKEVLYNLVSTSYEEDIRAILSLSREDREERVRSTSLRHSISPDKDALLSQINSSLDSSPRNLDRSVPDLARLLVTPPLENKSRFSNEEDPKVVSLCSLDESDANCCKRNQPRLRKESMVSMCSASSTTHDELSINKGLSGKM